MYGRLTESLSVLQYNFPSVNPSLWGIVLKLIIWWRGSLPHHFMLLFSALSTCGWVKIILVFIRFIGNYMFVLLARLFYSHQALLKSCRFSSRWRSPVSHIFTGGQEMPLSNMRLFANTWSKCRAGPVSRCRIQELCTELWEEQVGGIWGDK